MVPLPHDPTTFKEVVEADLRRAARLIISVQDEIDWQWRFASPDGDYHIVTTMPSDPYERTAMLRRIETFMVWRQALGYTMACETFEPDAVYCVGVGRIGKASCLARIRREPRPWTAANFGDVEWLPESSIDPVMVKLWPANPRPLTPKDVSALDKWFGSSGKFPAVHLPSRTLKGV